MQELSAFLVKLSVAMSSRRADPSSEQLLVAGYTRAIGVLLANNLLNTIPDTILLLFYEFYKYINKIGVAHTDTVIHKHHHY